MEELQKLVHILLNPQQNYSNEVKLHTQATCDKLIAEHAQDYSFFFSIIQSTDDPYLKFWAIGALGSVVEKFYAAHPVELRAKLHELFFAFVETNPAALFANTFIENRYALLFISIVKADYPTHWPDAFGRLLGLLNSKISDFALKIKVTDFILTALIEFDREVVEYYENKTQDDFQRGREIKEELRKGKVGDIALLLGEIIDNAGLLEGQNAGGLVNKALEAAEKIIAWASVETFMEKIVKLVTCLRSSSFQSISFSESTAHERKCSDCASACNM